MIKRAMKKSRLHNDAWILEQEISRNFDLASKEYDNYALVQKKAAYICTQMVMQSNEHFHSILDVGTGTGFVVENLLKLFPQAVYTLNDISSQMLEQTKKKFSNLPNMEYYLVNAENYIFPKSPYNLIVSNLAIQWFKNLEQGILNLWQQTNNILAFSTLCCGSFSSWKRECKKANLPCKMEIFPSFDSLKKKCLNLNPQKANFKLQKETLSFSSPLDFVRYLKKLGAHSSKKEQTICDLRKILKQCPSGIMAEYNIFHGVLKK